QIQVVGFGIPGLTLPRTKAASRPDIEAQHSCCLPYNVLFGIEDAAGFHIVGLGPELFAILGANKIRYDPKPPGRLAYAAFEECANVESLSNPAHIFLLTSKLKSRASRHHSQTGESGQGS